MSDADHNLSFGQGKTMKFKRSTHRHPPCITWLLTTTMAVSLSCTTGENGEYCPQENRIIGGECRSSPYTCGRPPPYPECQFASTQDATECHDVGGDWRCSDMFGWCDCVCRAGDGGCPCWDFSHCQGTCVVHDCSDVDVGTCSYDIVLDLLGCYCYMEKGVQTGVICTD